MERVIDIRTDEKSRADRVLADARRNLHIAHQWVESAKAATAEQATAAGELQATGRKLQAELGAATMRADQERLADELEDNQRQQRVANDKTVTSADTLTEAELREADLAALVEAAQRAANDAARAYEDAGKQEELFASWRAALDATGTADAIVTATKMETSADYTKARDRLVRLLGGEDMLTLYRRRATFAADTADDSRNLQLDAIMKAAEARTQSEPLTKQRMTSAATLALCIDRLQDASESTATRVSSAGKVFEELARRDAVDEGKEPLKSELVRIEARAEGARNIGAPDKETAAYDAWDAARRARREQAAAELVALAENPDRRPSGADGEQQPPTGAETAAADATTAAAEAQKTATEAQEALTRPADPNDPDKQLSPKAALDDYEIAIPPNLLADVIAFLDAEAAVIKTKTLDTGKLREEFGKAEAAYAAAERADVRARRAIAAVDAQVESKRRRVASSIGAAAAHKLLTIRGDR